MFVCFRQALMRTRPAHSGHGGGLGRGVSGKTCRRNVSQGPPPRLRAKGQKDRIQQSHNAAIICLFSTRRFITMNRAGFELLLPSTELHCLKRALFSSSQSVWQIETIKMDFVRLLEQNNYRTHNPVVPNALSINFCL